MTKYLILIGKNLKMGESGATLEKYHVVPLKQKKNDNDKKQKFLQSHSDVFWDEEAVKVIKLGKILN